MKIPSNLLFLVPVRFVGLCSVSITGLARIMPTEDRILEVDPAIRAP